MTTPTISGQKYQLYIWMAYEHHGAIWHWTPVGVKEHTKETALSWLKADFNIYKRLPEVKYKVVETTVYKDSKQDVCEGVREAVPVRG